MKNLSFFHKLLLYIVLILPLLGCQQAIRHSDEIVDTASSITRSVRTLSKTDEFKDLWKLGKYQYKIINAERINDTELLYKLKLKRNQKLTEIKCIVRYQDNTFVRAIVEDVQEFKRDLLQQDPDLNTEEDINQFIRSLCVAVSKART